MSAFALFNRGSQSRRPAES